MTKFSKILTIAVTFLAVAFMGVAAVTTAARVDYKEKLKQYPREETRKKKEEVESLDAQIQAVEQQHKAALAAINIDVPAMIAPGTGREAQLEVRLEALVKQSHDLAEQVEVESQKAQLKLDEIKLRREEIIRLQSQYEELVNQKESSQQEAKRLRDLLFQARGILERLERRMKLLEVDGAKAKYE